MASITVRGIAEEHKEALRVRAAKHGHSMEAELRRIICDAVKGRTEEGSLGTGIRRRFMRYGGLEVPGHSAVITCRRPSVE